MNAEKMKTPQIDVMQPTLVETSTGVFGCDLRDSQPDHGVGPLLRGPEAFLHRTMEVWHGIGHRWDTGREKLD